MHLVELQVYMSCINFWSEHLSVKFDGICSSRVVAYYLYENHNTTNNFMSAKFTSVCSKLFKLFLTTVWFTKTGWEMTSRLIR